ncbi:hypothetical protein [Simkania negevensis]|uniref:Uncharacterized protein n=1 Tax=Simkania negevensis (strain ATCC VR-1471 / DSM 27360 / Z) TaxID=331113 RepID=F8L2V8_SIMNZ|nr:hypothetical protein [Simkania negevensis]CCB87804.1 unknown protein [Simkania negevensis Z]
MATEIQLKQVVHPSYKQGVGESDSSQSSGEVSVPLGIADTKSTITPAPKKDCCDYIVPPEKQPNCWQGLTPCQKTTICCGGVVVAGGGTLGALIGTGTISASGGGLVAIIVIGVCCSIKLAVGTAWCYAKFSSQDK